MIILDMDSSVSPTHGEQEGTAYHGHFGCTCYHPLFLFNQFGDLERCSLRPGNVHSADGWRNVLEPVVMRYKERKVRLYFRGDAAFASPEIYEYLEAEGLLYVIRLKANAILQRNIAHLLTRPVGRPPDHQVRRFHAESASAIRPDPGTRSAVSWPKWMAPRRAEFLASALIGFTAQASLICRALPMAGGGVRRSPWHGSAHQGKKARTPSLDPSGHVASSATRPIGLKLSGPGHHTQGQSCGWLQPKDGYNGLSARHRPRRP